MKRTLTQEQLTRLIVERRGQRMANRDRSLARRYAETHMILARPLLPKRRQKDVKQGELGL